MEKKQRKDESLQIRTENAAMKLKRFDYTFDAITARYLLDEQTGEISLVLLPEKQRQDAYDHHRTWLRVPELVRIDMDGRAWHVGNLVHLAIQGDAQGNGAGNTLKYGASTKNLRFCSQKRQDDTIMTRLQAENGIEVLHRLTWVGGSFRVETEFYNGTSETLTLDLLTSFSLDNLSPYDLADSSQLRLHRFRGGWSMEGLHLIDDVEKLNLACPWMYAFPESERFGVIGSHPVGRYFPVCAVEDPAAGVFWGASFAAAGSWQMELSRDSDCYSLSGGLGDCESTGWSRTVAPGARFVPPPAYVTVAHSLDQVCSRLYGWLEQKTEQQPESEQSLPVVFNEWCTTWGNPSHKRMLALADALKGTPVKYLVIDAGWTNVIPNSFGQGGNGDWEYAPDRFPGGLLATSRALKKKGFLTGVWFEFEVTTRGAKVYGNAWDTMHLTRNRKVIVTGDGRSFWDFRNPDVIDYLKTKVLNFLRDNEIRYLKVDYNGSIGVGCDGGSSLGDALQEHLQGVLRFFDLLRQELPDLVIEDCAAGGHRLTIPFLERCGMASFSDAHEGPEIPILAARLHRLVPPRQLQIWAVLNSFQTIREINYRLASGFLGRLCLSGGIDSLNEKQQAWMRNTLELYRRTVPAIRKGETVVYGDGNRNFRHLSGWQAVLRQSGELLMMVIHTFTQPPKTFLIPLPNGTWYMTDEQTDTLALHQKQGHLEVSHTEPFCGAVVLWKKSEM